MLKSPMTPTNTCVKYLGISNPIAIPSSRMGTPQANTPMSKEDSGSIGQLYKLL